MIFAFRVMITQAEECLCVLLYLFKIIFYTRLYIFQSVIKRTNKNCWWPNVVRAQDMYAKGHKLLVFEKKRDYIGLKTNAFNKK